MFEQKRHPKRKNLALLVSLMMIVSLVISAGLNGVYGAASGVPAVPSLSHDNWDGDGSYNITMNLWWGNNGTSVKLYENSQLISTDALTDNSPNQQSFKKAMSGKAKGVYTYKCELINSFGKTTSNVVTVNVTVGLPQQTAKPTNTPTIYPTTPPTAKPTSTPTAKPTATPTVQPTTPPTTQPPTTQMPSERMYVGYASTWNTSIYDLTTANIPNYFTHINLAFAQPDTTYQKGSYAFDQAIAGFEFVEGALTNSGQKKFTAQQAQDLRNNIAALKARGTQVWVSVGGWAYSQGTKWANFNAAHLVDLAQDLGASGIDIDWESSGSAANKLTADQFACSKDAEIKGVISELYNEIKSRGVNLGISIAGWSTGAYYVKGTPFEEGKIQWGSPFGGTMYRVVKDYGYMINHINLMSYDAGDYFDPREGYESYRAIYNGPINMGMEIAPEGAGGSVLKINAEPGTVYDAEMLTGQNNIASKYYNVETMVNYIKNKGKPFDGFMIWQIWKERVHAPAPAGAASVNSAGQYVCRNLPLRGDANQVIPNLPKLTP
ncbi:MAG: glycosyl hydrolase family 18 protein [Clostridia bacterium]|nr:glycosyl hydrolase family 18 protein [Clostridia bacterium]